MSPEEAVASVVALVVAVRCGFICCRRWLRLLEAAASFSGGGGVIPWRRRLRLSEEAASVVGGAGYSRHSSGFA